MAPLPAQPIELLKWLDEPGTWQALAPRLSAGARIDFSLPEGGPEARGPRELPPAGILRLSAQPRDSTVVAAREAIEAVSGAGLPPVFAYAYDAPWELLERLAPLAQEYLGPFDVLSDAWAFRVEPGSAGWPPHRGFVERVERCTTLNVWVALSDANVDTSCMWFLPLDRDPAYPDDLASTRVPEGRAVAAEVQAGDILAWDARVLHWGGAMSKSSPTPRMSITFTLRSRDHRAAGLPVLELGALDLRARLDLIAREISKYQELARTSPELHAWARLTVETASVARARVD